MLPQEHVLIGTFLVVFDLVGTFVFALSGAVAGIRHKLDLFGVLVLSFAAANAGGITRDLLIGAVPPVGISDWRYVTIAMCAGLAAFYWGRVAPRVVESPLVRDWDRVRDRWTRTVLLLDAAGLSLYAVAGALKALAYHMGPVPAVLLGGITGIGGGVLRDILVSEVPVVMRSELYAVAALAGAAIVVVGRTAGWPSSLIAPAGAIVCFALRFMAIHRGWGLPVAGTPIRRDRP
jgi:uncharacterized membrane protein YeiH